MKYIWRYYVEWNDDYFTFWFDVNRSTFYEDTHENDFDILVTSDLDLWPSDHKFAP